jgi:hypothetical protein
MDDKELLKHAVRFEFAGEISIQQSPFSYPEGSWYIKRGDELLDKEHGWRLYNTVTDGRFLFATPHDAAAYLVAQGLVK